MSKIGVAPSPSDRVVVEDTDVGSHAVPTAGMMALAYVVGPNGAAVDSTQAERLTERRAQ